MLEQWHSVDLQDGDVTVGHSSLTLMLGEPLGESYWKPCFLLTFSGLSYVLMSLEFDGTVGNLTLSLRCYV